VTVRSLELTASELDRRQAVRDALAEWGSRDRVRAVLARAEGADLPVVQALAGRGWFDHGDQTLTLLAVAMEEVGRHPMPGPWQAGLIQGAAIPAALGHAKLAAGAARGEPWTIWCGDGAEVIARRVGDGWRLTGRVPVVADAGVAGLLLVPALGGVFVVAVGEAGVSLEPVLSVGADRACSVRLDDAVASLLGDDPVALRQALDLALVAQCAELVGVSSAALDVAVAYVNEREQWGRPIGTFQGVQHGAADRYLDVEAMRWAVYDAAGHGDSGRPLGLVASMAKVVCVEGALRVTAWAHQVHGGEGFYADQDPGLFYRRARALAPRLGDVRWHLARIDALRRPRSGSPGP
jgi:alkylation response protein AidB-like acyl-CoA dehydrogenase